MTDLIYPRSASETTEVATNGVWWDVFYKKDDLGKEGITYVSKKHNIVMSKLANLFAGFLHNDGNLATGIAYHALGEGLVAWDTATPIPSPPVTNEKLEAEFFRKEPSIIEYIDESGAPFTPTGDPGNPADPYIVQPRVRLKTIFNYGDANGYWIREQAIFGGDATDTLDSGHIINIIRHPKIKKEASLKIERFIQFSLHIT